MNLLTAKSLGLSLLLSLAPLTATAQSQSSQQTGNSQAQSAGQATDSNGQPAGQHEAMKMVPARAALLTTLDAKKTQVGETFQAKLVKKVQLKDGHELPAGTILVGSVAADDMQQGGLSRLAIRFTAATLKDGTSVLIKATLVGIARVGGNDSDGEAGQADDQLPATWTDGTLAIDQLDALPGTDLHSRIASHNSGVFVSTKKDNITLHSGSELQLAIAVRHSQDEAGGTW